MNEFKCPKGHACKRFLPKEGEIKIWTCPLCGGLLVKSLATSPDDRQ